jgi:hypothetical protein
MKSKYKSVWRDIKNIYKDIDVYPYVWIYYIDGSIGAGYVYGNFNGNFIDHYDNPKKVGMFWCYRVRNNVCEDIITHPSEEFIENIFYKNGVRL